MSAPTLIVGLGGTGSKIVRIVYERATEKQRANIRFVVFDTDVNELRQIEEETPSIRVIQTSNRLTVGEYLDKDTFARDEWFPVNKILYNKALTEGAGQVRAISRLALDTAIQQGKIKPLDESIEDLYKLTGQRTEQAPRVILVGSLCGGTGSGLILPISMYIRNFLTSKLQHGTASIRGFFLLPEVFESVIETQSERESQRANAYAAVKEINAFMLKSDEKLPSRYNPQFKAPRAGSKELDEYKGSPMDFCFLFDAQNLNGERLNSFEEYKEHAANCIYGMAIAPTSQRSNSSEDNIITTIIKGAGKNRFAGAGTAMLVYPTSDVEKYLTLNWTRTTISDDWLSIDKRFAVERDRTRKARAQGIQLGEIDRGEHYTDIVENGDKEGKYFEKAIASKSVIPNSQGFGEAAQKWKKYREALDAYIDECVEKQKEKYKSRLDVLTLSENAAKATGKDSKDSDGGESDLAERYRSWYGQLRGYSSETKTDTKDLAASIGFGLFGNNTDYILRDVSHPYYIEYWLHDSAENNAFIHPNAARYLLYKIKAELAEGLKEYDARVSEIENRWNTFPKRTFDIKETKNEEKEEDYYKAYFNLPLFKRLIHFAKINDAITNLNTSFSTYRRDTDDYWPSYLKKELYTQAISYINQISEVFEQFYDSLDRYIPSLDRQIELLEQKYRYEEGQALRYVCADEKCLKGLASEVTNPNDAMSLPGELSQRIYGAMRSYALAQKKPDADDYYREVFNNSIKEYLRSEIISHHKSLVHMDVLSAIEKEAKYAGGEAAKDPALYSKHVLEAVLRLATPFIESPVGEEPRMVTTCTYSKKLHNDDIAGREAFIKRYLLGSGGVEDDSIDIDMILFYKAVYDIEAADLSKFARPVSRQTFERTGGDYYKAYFERIADLNPDTTKSTSITPHIDKWWHVITKLPDIDDDSQKFEESQIYTAFFWGIIGKYIKYKAVDAIHNAYYINRPYLKLTANDGLDSLIVSNGTTCDHLYEVLDALTVYPRLVKLILTAVDNRIQNELYNKVPFERSVLMESLNSFEIEEQIQSTDQTLRRSIFDILMLMKWSVLPEDYHPETMEGLLKAILAEIKEYIVHYFDSADRLTVYTDLLMNQYELFISNMNAEKTNHPNVFREELVQSITDELVTEFQTLDMNDLSKKVETILLENKAK